MGTQKELKSGQTGHGHNINTVLIFKILMNNINS